MSDKRLPAKLVRHPDPTPEQIAERSAEVRSRWTAADYERNLRWMNRGCIDGRSPKSKRGNSAVESHADTNLGQKTLYV